MEETMACFGILLLYIQQLKKSEHWGVNAAATGEIPARAGVLW